MVLRILYRSVTWCPGKNLGVGLLFGCFTIYGFRHDILSKNISLWQLSNIRIYSSKYVIPVTLFTILVVKFLIFVSTVNFNEYDASLSASQYFSSGIQLQPFDGLPQWYHNGKKFAGIDFWCHCFRVPSDYLFIGGWMWRFSSFCV